MHICMYVYIGTLQKHLMKHDPQCEDEILLALAGIKQVVS